MIFLYIQTRTIAFFFFHTYNNNSSHERHTTHPHTKLHTLKSSIIPRKKNTMTFHVKIDIIFTHEKKTQRKNIHIYIYWFVFPK
jgi:hypothetical protein